MLPDFIILGTINCQINIVTCFGKKTRKIKWFFLLYKRLSFSARLANQAVPVTLQCKQTCWIGPRRLLVSISSVCLISFVLSCMHQPIQPKNLSWWGEIGNSLIFQHSPSRGGSLRPQMWNRSEQQLFYLIALTRIRTQDFWLWYYIELHAPTNSIQKLKLMGRGGQFTYIPILPLTWRLPQTSDVE